MKLFYREFGSGIPLVILHGLYGSSDNWVSIARALSDRFRVILPDQRNHGSSHHSQVHSYEAMSMDLHELAEDLGLSKFYLVGHSMGGKTAMYYSFHHAERVAGLIVIDISPFRVSKENNKQAEFHKSILDALISIPLQSVKNREDVEQALSGTIPSARIRRFILKNLTRDEDKSLRWKINPAYLKLNLDKILDGFNRGDTLNNQISGFPVVFVRASESDYIDDSDYPYIKTLFTSAEIVEVENTSHWIHAEKPDIIIELIREIAE